MKWCPNCHQNKCLCEYQKSSTRKDGVQHWCRDCCLAYGVTYRHSEKGREVRRQHGVVYNKQYSKTERGRAMRKKVSDKHRQLYPTKIKARSAIRTAVKMGKLPPARTSECVYCGSQAVYWHHYLGYAFEHALDVIPLCKRCDYKAHHNITPYYDEVA